MKSYIQFLLVLGHIMLVPVVATASVDITNNSPGYIAHVTMQNHITCNSGYETYFTCEHYLNYGESLVYNDGSEGPDCSHFYSVASIT